MLLADIKTQPTATAPLQGFDDAFLALAAARDAHAHLRRPAARPLAPGRAATGDGRRTLNEWASKRWLAGHGVAVPAGRCVAPGSAGAAATELGFPVALKAVSADLPHKTEAGAVVLGLADGEAVEAAAQAMLARLAAARPAHRIERLLVEAMAPRPVAELIVGIDRDPHFGPVLAIGAGGVLAELLGDVATLLLPADADEVRAALLGLKIAGLLAGFRGGPPGDIDAAVAAIVAIGQAALAAPGLLELDVNPLFVLPRGQGVIAVDALLVMAEDHSGTGENVG